MRQLLVLSVAITVVARGVDAQSTSTPVPLAVTHATVIDVRNGRLLADRTVLIRGDRIAAVGKTSLVRLPPDAHIVEARGKYLIPGLWDMHVHVRSARPEWANWYFGLFLANGVTGVREMGTYLDTLVALRAGITSGTIIAPRLVAAGPQLDGPRPLNPYAVTVATAAEATSMVDSLARSGVDFIKVMEHLPREAFFAIVERARHRGLPVAGHVPQALSAREASDAGVKSIEHSNGILRACSTREAQLRDQALALLASAAGTGPALREEIRRAQARPLLDSYSAEKCAALIARFARNGTWHVPTLTGIRGRAFPDDSALTHDPRLRYMLPSVLAAWTPQRDFQLRDLTPQDLADRRRTFRKYVELTGAMHRAGVGVLAGSDVPNPYTLPGFSLQDEMALLVEAGLTPLSALRAATYNPARFLGALDSLGTVERGKLADLVLLDANPLQDIRNTRKIAAVVAGGRLIDRAACRKLLDDAEAASSNR